MGLTLKDRTVIAKRWKDGDSATAIAKDLGFAPGTIYAELARGRTGGLDRNSRPKYDPAKGQAVYQANLRKRGNREQRRRKPCKSKGAKENDQL